LEERVWTCLIASTLAAAFTTLGIYSIRRFRPWAERNSTYFVSFAAGVLIAASFLHVIPKSFAMTIHAPGYLLAGFVMLYLFNRFITAYVCGTNPESQYAIGLVPMLGIGFHSFLDGIIYSITFTVSVFTGVLAGTGMVLHEFPEGIITYMLLLRSGFSEHKSLLLAFLAAGLSTPLGTLVSLPFVSQISQPVLGALLALSAGALVYVGATHLLPQAEREPKKYSLVALGGGILVAVAIALSESLGGTK
jgi:zinc and cadmium transporter